MHIRIHTTMTVIVIVIATLWRTIWQKLSTARAADGQRKTRRIRGRGRERGTGRLGRGVMIAWVMSGMTGRGAMIGGGEGMGDGIARGGTVGMVVVEGETGVGMGTGRIGMWRVCKGGGGCRDGGILLLGGRTDEGGEVRMGDVDGRGGGIYKGVFCTLLLHYQGLV